MKLEKTNRDYIYKYQTKSGKKYRVRYTYTDYGVREFFDKSGFKTMAEAASALGDFQDLHTRHNRVPRETMKTYRLTIEQFFEEFYNKKTQTGQWSGDSEISYRKVFHGKILPRWGQYRLRDISRTEYELWINKLLKKHRRNSVKSYHQNFMALLNDAVYSGYLEKNPCVRIYIGESSIEALNKHVSIEDYKIWMALAKEKLAIEELTLVTLASFGLRRGEILGLSFDSIHTNTIDNRVELHIKDSVTKGAPDGKGGLKTKGSDRWVTLSESASELLLRCIEDTRKYAFEKHNRILSEHDYIFVLRCRNKQIRWIKPDYVHTIFSKISKICGIHITCHMLRHFFVTQSIVAGVPMEDTARFVGHTQIYMTEHYTHIQNETSRRVIDSLSKRLEL